MYHLSDDLRFFIVCTLSLLLLCFFFFFNDPATTDIYTLSLHDALPIYFARGYGRSGFCCRRGRCGRKTHSERNSSEEHTSELQSLKHRVCRLLLEKNKAIG